MQVALVYQEQAELLAKSAHSDRDPLGWEKSLAERLWQLSEDNLGQDDFSYNQVLSYFIKLELCERFNSYNQEQGLLILEALSQRVREITYES